MAATSEIDTPIRPGHKVTLPVEAATLIYAGTLVAVNAAGNAVPASDTANLRVIGRAETTQDNTLGSAGALSIDVARGIFLYGNSTTHALTAGSVGAMAYVEDNQTIASTSTNRIPAGRVVALDADGFWIDTTFARGINTAALTSAQVTTTNAVDLATAEALANALKTALNAVQTDVAALHAALVANGTIVG